MLKVFELFAGIGANTKALKNLGIEHELAGYSEFDKYASKSFAAIHGVSEELNYGDVTKINTDTMPDFDLLTYGFPCQDISVAGKQAGLEGETRSSLYREAFRIIKTKKPRYAIMENVKNLVGKKFRDKFEEMLLELEEMGYTNYWKVLNAKDYGVPQNRQRVFVISILGEHEQFVFPEGFDNGIRLKDMLEDEVDEKYYISQDKVEKLLAQLDWKNRDKVCCDMTINQPKFKDIGNCIKARYDAGIVNQKSEGIGVVVPCLTPDRIEKRQNGRRFKEDGEPMFTLTGQDRHGVLQVGMLDIKGNEQVRRVYADDGVSPTLNTMQGGNRQPKVLIENNLKFIGGIEDSNKRIEDGKELSRNFKEGYRVYDSDGIACCQKVDGGGLGGNTGLYKTNYRIRKLTPTECWRLMSFTDADIQKCIDAGISNTQLYKQAGNSIVVKVLEGIYNNLL